MCEERIKALEEDIERLKEDIKWRDAQTESIEKSLEFVKRQASIPKKMRRARGVRIRDTSVETIEGQLTSSQRKASSLRSEKAILEEELEKLKN